MQFDNKDLKPLPIGVEKFDEPSDYYYVDKTLLIKQIIDDKSKVYLFTRPRRFGKMLNMDMLKTYFEISNNDNSIYFKDKKIWQCGEKYTNEQGKYPVIALSFKDVKFKEWDTVYDNIQSLIKEFQYPFPIHIS